MDYYHVIKHYKLSYKEQSDIDKVHELTEVKLHNLHDVNTLQRESCFFHTTVEMYRYLYSDLTAVKRKSKAGLLWFSSVVYCSKLKP